MYGGKRRFSQAQYPQQQQQQPMMVQMEIIPVSAKDENGWQLWLGRSKRLFWHHPTRGAVQWQTPSDVKCVAEGEKGGGGRKNEDAEKSSEKKWKEEEGARMAKQEWIRGEGERRNEEAECSAFNQCVDKERLQRAEGEKKKKGGEDNER